MFWNTLLYFESLLTAGLQKYLFKLFTFLLFHRIFEEIKIVFFEILFLYFLMYLTHCNRKVVIFVHIFLLSFKFWSFLSIYCIQDSVWLLFQVAVYCWSQLFIRKKNAFTENTGIAILWIYWSVWLRIIFQGKVNFSLSDKFYRVAG